MHKCQTIVAAERRSEQGPGIHYEHTPYWKVFESDWLRIPDRFSFSSYSYCTECYCTLNARSLAAMRNVSDNITVLTQTVFSLSVVNECDIYILCNNPNSSSTVIII